MSHRSSPRSKSFARLLRRLSWLVPLVFCCSVAVLSRAQEATTSEYEDALSHALDAHAHGDFDTARTYMERAHALEPSARTFRGLGIVAFAQGRFVEAIRYLESALSSSEKPLSAELRDSVEDLLARASSQVGRYELWIEPEGSEVLFDGVAPDYLTARTVVLLPGRHLLRVRADGHAPYDLTLEVEPGVRERLHVVLAAIPQAQANHVQQEQRPASITPTAHRVPAPQSPRDRERPTWWTPRLRWIGIGVGAAFVSGGVALYLVGRSKLDDIADECRAMADGVCTTSQAQKRFDREHVQAFAISSAVLAATGSALLLTTGGIELWRWRKRRSLELHPGLSSFVLSGTF